LESQFFQCPPEQCGEDLRREELGIGHEAQLHAPVAKLVETVNETRHGPNRVDADFVLQGQPANVDPFRRRGSRSVAISRAMVCFHTSTISTSGYAIPAARARSWIS